MAEEMPQGVNSAMLESMRQSSGGGAFGGGGMNPNGDRIGGDINRILMSKTMGNMDDLGTASSDADSFFSSFRALGSNPFFDAFNGNLSPAGVSHQTFADPQLLGNTELKGVSFGETYNAKLPKLSSAQGRGAAA
ncbi:MAG TPA: hypothetical protein VI861_00795 [Rickettsiales bacterium]|nr:hypothetical protein [Rickettsiales bacterium]